MKPKGRGFTLLELLIVLGIIVAITAAVTPSIIDKKDRYVLNAGTREVASILRYARSKAISTQQNQLVSFNLDTLEYGVLGESDLYQLNEAILLDILAAQTQVSGNQAGFLFYPDGASTGGRITMRFGEDAKAVDIVWMTGLVNIIEDIDE